jgi:protein SCO1/2
MSRRQKTVAIAMWILAVGAMMGVLALKEIPSGRSSTLADLPVLYDAPTFSLTSQDNAPFSSDQLRGHPWIADFIFTTCTSLCPMMSTHMATLQNEIPPDVKLVSFSVDPEHDTPAALKDYGVRYGAQPGKWIFLTGDLKTQTAVVTAMKLYFKPADGQSAIQHDQHFVLVDGQGHVRGYYDSYSPDDMDHLVRDAKILADQSDGGGSQ